MRCLLYSVPPFCEQIYKQTSGCCGMAHIRQPLLLYQQVRSGISPCQAPECIKLAGKGRVGWQWWQRVGGGGSRVVVVVVVVVVEELHSRY